MQVLRAQQFSCTNDGYETMPPPYVNAIFERTAVTKIHAPPQGGVVNEKYVIHKIGSL